METIEKTALRHNMVALLHEKPFEGVNGSGKHNNWSLSTDDGKNLFSPGKDPQTNKSFLLFVSAVIEAVDRYYPLLRATTATATNDHRLGGHEAPPAIISIFLGDELTTILENIALGKNLPVAASLKLNLDVDVIPSLRIDAGDRNRTSPFAFTGNKFEFRMPGLSEYADKLEKSDKGDLDKTIVEIITDAYKKHGRIIFNGNGYSEEWQEEAKRRGLTNEISANTALRKYLDPEILRVTEETGMLTLQESASRYNAYAERYITHLCIEARTLIDMANKYIIPFGLKYSNLLAENIERVEKFYPEAAKEQKLLLESVLTDISNIRKETKLLEAKIEEVKKEENLEKQTDLAKEFLVEGLENLRVPCDNLEKIVDNEIWTLPTYTDLLFKL